MKLHEIPAHLGITAAQLGELMDVSPQALNNYLRGRKNKGSKFISRLINVANLSREEIIFPDRFDHPDGKNPEHPAYWVNIAMDAINSAREKGLPTEYVIFILKVMHNSIIKNDLLTEIKEQSK